MASKDFRTRGFTGCLLLGALILSSPVPSVANTSSAAAKRQELKHLRVRIKHVQQGLEAKMSRRGKLTRQLRASEQKIARLTTAIEQTKTDLASTHTRLKRLRVERAHAQVALTREKTALKQSIVASYMAGREQRIKLLLNQENPVQLGRMLVYYDYFTRARSRRINRVRELLARLHRVGSTIHSELEKLTALESTHRQALAKLQATRAARARLLSRVNAAISRQGTKLKQMRQDEKSITTLLQSLRSALNHAPQDIERGTNFANLKDQLVWPLQGRLLAHYGEPMANGKMHRQGDLIAAPRGTPVHAISFGRVIYADWLAHFGLLVIIDHGDGYMSLYGHNQSIYTRVGDWVKPDAVIASLGESGGQSEPALYFEIRHGNTALDPHRWCAGKLAQR